MLIPTYYKPLEKKKEEKTTNRRCRWIERWMQDRLSHVMIVFVTWWSFLSRDGFWDVIIGCFMWWSFVPRHGHLCHVMIVCRFSHVVNVCAIWKSFLSYNDHDYHLLFIIIYLFLSCDDRLCHVMIVCVIVMFVCVSCNNRLCHVSIVNVPWLSFVLCNDAVSVITNSSIS
jgi:hypothetical protein